LDTFQAPLLVCKKNTFGPGLTRAAAHIFGEAIAQSYFSMVDCGGSAARMEASVHSPAAGEEVEAPDGVALSEALMGAPELDGPPWVGVADVVTLLEDPDEHPVSNASPVPPQATRTVALLTLM